ncbi:hypothetical protein LR69_00349 [Geobacillus sp. BCO2]|nr:hypothetical protein LR69_00349 [Geobacillus sp. BCO2]
MLPLPTVNRHFQQMKRVDYEIWKSPVSLLQLVRFIREHKQLLVVFNTRKEAKECVELLQEDEGYSIFPPFFAVHIAAEF